jgi:hypothetical protein
MRSICRRLGGDPSDLKIAAVELGRSVTVGFRLEDDLARLVDRAARGGEPAEIYLIAEGIEFERPGLMGIRVLVNSRNPETETEGPSYVDTLSSFGSRPHQGHEKSRYVMDLVPTLQARWSPHPLIPRGGLRSH